MAAAPITTVWEGATDHGAIPSAQIPSGVRVCRTGVLAFLVLAQCAPEASGPTSELAAALNEIYPDGWRYATLREDLRSEMAPGDSPAWITGDFNGDGRADYAAQIVVNRPGHTLAVDSAQLLLTLMRHNDRFKSHVLSTGGGPHEGIFLSRLQPGDTIRDIERGIVLVPEHAGVYKIFANEAALAYVYDHGLWKEIFLAD